VNISACGFWQDSQTPFATKILPALIAPQLEEERPEDGQASVTALPLPWLFQLQSCDQ